ncbi:MAG: diaminopimelate epimerase [Legionellaceae bacterium]|nr:diaminopimelate epimerase [Legionellaceae bacterium]
MNLKFTKMHGLGNDFMVIDATRHKIQLTPDMIQTLSRRDTGVGFDQCLLVEPSTQANIDFFYRIFNADGTPVGQCGNGARCLARFIQHYGLSPKTTLRVATTTTKLTLHINPDNTVTVDMGCPVWAPEQIPLLETNEAESYTLTLTHHAPVRIHAVALGNPHAIMIVDNIDQAPVDILGPQIETHPLFPEHTNVGFLELDTSDHILLRVHERGTGETRACGSGAAAAAAVARRFYGLDAKIRVSVPGGDLWVDWADTHSSLSLTGPAEFVYEGKLLSMI